MKTVRLAVILTTLIFLFILSGCETNRTDNYFIEGTQGIYVTAAAKQRILESQDSYTLTYTKQVR